MQLTALWEYPVKSCQSRALESAEVTTEGFRHDRRYLLVNPQGRFITQRELPQMVNIKAYQDSGDLVFEVNGQQQRYPATSFTNTKEVSIWKDQVLTEVTTNSTDMLSDYLGTELSLVRLPIENRPISDRSAEGHVSFADGLPYLLTTTASLADLNQRLKQPVPMLNFRPNLVLSTTEAYAEDHWQRIRIGEVIFRAVKPCSRCVMTTVDINTGTPASDMEPLKTLAGYRMVQGEGVIFGMNLVAENNGWVHLEDPAEVLA